MSNCSHAIGGEMMGDYSSFSQHSYDIIWPGFFRLPCNAGRFWELLHKSLLSTWMKLNKAFLRLWIYAQQALQASAWEALSEELPNIRLQSQMRLSETWYCPLVPTNSQSLTLIAEAASVEMQRYCRSSQPPWCWSMECGSVLAAASWGSMCCSFWETLSPWWWHASRNSLCSLLAAVSSACAPGTATAVLWIREALGTWRQAEGRGGGRPGSFRTLWNSGLPSGTGTTLPLVFKSLVV